MNPSIFMERAAGGGRQDLETVISLLHFRNEKAKAAILKFNPEVFIARAFQGDGWSLLVLGDLESCGNLLARETLRKIKSKIFIPKAKQGDVGSMRALKYFALRGDIAALNSLIDIASKGDDTAFESVCEITDFKVSRLRNAHLQERVSSQELERRLSHESNGNPFMMYLFYCSPENFGDLSKMILARLNAQAKSKGISLHSYMQQLDPQRIFYRYFVLQAANFSQLGALISSPEDLYRVMDLLFKDLPEEAIKEFCVRLALLLEKATDDPSFRYQREFQFHLRELYNRTKGLNQYLVATLLTVYRERLNFLDRDDIVRLSREQGIEPGSFAVDYSQLFKSSKLVVHIVFADADAVRDHYLATAQIFLGNNPAYPNIGGYRRVSSSERQMVLEKGDIRIVLINADEERYNIDEHLGEVGMVVSRSHAGSEWKVFREQSLPRTTYGIFLISSCRSASLIGELSRDYSGAAFIGINEVGKGMDTNIVTYYLLEALQQGRQRRSFRTFSEIKRYIRPHLEKGIGDYIFPVDPSVGVKDIIYERAGTPEGRWILVER
jgi:hypothetical protein